MGFSFVFVYNYCVCVCFVSNTHWTESLILKLGVLRKSQEEKRHRKYAIMITLRFLYFQTLYFCVLSLCFSFAYCVGNCRIFWSDIRIRCYLQTFVIFAPLIHPLLNILPLPIFPFHKNSKFSRKKR